MEIKPLKEKIQNAMSKYRYAALVLVIGLALLLLPGKSTQRQAEIADDTPTVDRLAAEVEALTEILQSIQGAGKVQVLLSIGAGEEIIYKTNTEISNSGDSGITKIETVIVTDSQRNEEGLITQINPPKYLGAVVVCQGADSPVVKLAIMQAVSKITGLGADAICVLKMK
jgi:stage III sporulation protein AG